MNEIKAENNGEQNIPHFLKRSNWPLFVLLFASFLAYLSWGLVIQQTSPFSSPDFAIPLFHITFFFAITTTFALIETFFHVVFFSFHAIGRSVNIAVRQGIIIGIIADTALIFQQFRVLTWWNAVLLLIMGFLIELAFQDKD